MNLILSIIIVHWIADFVSQSDYVAKNKSKRNDILGCHAGVYTLEFLIFGWKFAFINGVIHFCVDYFTSRWSSRLWAKGKVHNYYVVIGLDQLIHTATLIATSGLITFWGIQG
jgi:hypothetical protein